LANTAHPSAVVEPDVQLGDGCEIHPGAILRRHSVLGDRVYVHPYAVIGGDPQDLRFERGTVTGVRIGNGTTLREYCTINRATKPGGATSVGENGFLMAGVHLAHDCQVGNQVVLANNVLLAGHVQVGDFVFIGGGAAVHQFCRIGEGAMIAGLARITFDVPPFVMVAERDEVIGLNLVGLKRRGFSRDVIRELKMLYRALYFGSGRLRELASDALNSGAATTAEGKRFLEFFGSGKRGFARVQRTKEESASDE
jgi:UDP-N-acetylglucosamine acyltransferase